MGAGRFPHHRQDLRATAARIFGVPFDSIVKGNPNYKYRQRGKVATLALGYQAVSGP